MTQIQVRPAQTRRERAIFVNFPWKIYHHDPLWVAPILSDRLKTIDPRRGPFFRHGHAEFFIAWKDGRPAGTICAAEDWELNQARQLRDCVIGFFECIDDLRVAQTLFQRASQWAKEHQLNSLYGPFNLDYEDSYGVLIEGRSRPPALLCGHSPPYYQGFFEATGFQPARGDNLAFGLDLADSPVLQQLLSSAERAKSRTKITIRTADFNRWEEEIDNILPLINTALAHLTDHRPWPRETLQALFEPFRRFADPELILLLEDQGKTIGFLPGIANMNEILIHAHGLRTPWDYLNLWLHSRKKIECLSIKSVLLYPEYWGSSAAILMFAEMLTRARQKGYRWVDLSLTSADNPRTPALAERFGAKIYKRYRVYRLRLN